MRNFIVSFRKIITSRGFWLCMIMTTILLFAAEIHIDTETQNRYSSIRALLSFTREELASKYEMCNIMVLKSARGGWFTLFAPIITGFCFVPLMCTEREENAVRFQIFRTSKLKYSVTEFLSGVISGGLAMTLGYLIFSIAAMRLFPDISEMTGMGIEILQSVSFNFPRLVLGMWLYGAFWSMPAMVLTSVMRNKYLVMCIPFFVKYGLTQTYHKIQENAFSSEEVDMKMLEFAGFIYPDGLLWISDSTRLSAALLFGTLSIAFFAAFIIIMQKRGDCGA